MFDKPGCFGFAATYSVKSPTCEACNEKQGCAERARQSLEKLAQVINVDAALKNMHAVQRVARAERKLNKPKPSLPEAIQKRLEALPRNTARVGEVLFAKGIDYRSALEKGLNPIRNDSPKSISLLFDLLIEGPVTRNQYLMALKNEGQSAATAASQATIGFTLVTKFGIAVYDGVQLTIRRLT